jgi:hypothetical protein
MASYPTLHEIRTAADEYWQLWEVCGRAVARVLDL